MFRRWHKSAPAFRHCHYTKLHYYELFNGWYWYKLAPESGGKLLSKWQGPGTVAKVMSQNSYLVDLGSNGTRHIHANTMRHFVARVNGCSVINDGDADFGSVLTHSSSSMRSAKNDRSRQKRMAQR